MEVPRSEDPEEVVSQLSLSDQSWSVTSDAFSCETGINSQTDLDWWNTSTRLERDSATNQYSKMLAWNNSSVRRPFGDGPKGMLKRMLELPPSTLHGLKFAPTRASETLDNLPPSDGVWRKAKKTRIQRSDDDIRDLALKRLSNIPRSGQCLIC